MCSGLGGKKMRVISRIQVTHDGANALPGASRAGSLRAALLHRDDAVLQGEEGAGAWSQALRQAPDGVCRPGAMRINGVQCRGTLICLKALYGANGVMASIDDL